VKERRKGPIGRAAGIAEGVAATVRRMQREREPRVLVYDESGYARLVQPDGRGYERLLDTADRMVALVNEVEAEAKPRLGRRPEGDDESKRRREDRTPDDESKPKPRRARRPRAEDDA
jgi:hypothetical protein